MNNSWEDLIDWLKKYVEIDPWEVKALVTDFCEENGRGIIKDVIIKNNEK
jgi:hypothetical protein